MPGFCGSIGDLIRLEVGDFLTCVEEELRIRGYTNPGKLVSELYRKAYENAVRLVREYFTEYDEKLIETVAKLILALSLCIKKKTTIKITIGLVEGERS